MFSLHKPYVSASENIRFIRGKGPFFIYAKDIHKTKEMVSLKKTTSLSCEYLIFEYPDCSCSSSAIRNLYART